MWKDNLEKTGRKEGGKEGKKEEQDKRRKKGEELKLDRRTASNS